MMLVFGLFTHMSCGVNLRPLAVHRPQGARRRLRHHRRRWQRRRSRGRVPVEIHRAACRRRCSCLAAMVLATAVGVLVRAVLGRQEGRGAGAVRRGGGTVATPAPAQHDAGRRPDHRGEAPAAPLRSPDRREPVRLPISTARDRAPRPLHPLAVLPGQVPVLRLQQPCPRAHPAGALRRGAADGAGMGGRPPRPPSAGLHLLRRRHPEPDGSRQPLLP